MNWKSSALVVAMMAVAGCSFNRSDLGRDTFLGRIGGGGQIIEPKRCNLRVAILSRPLRDEALNDALWSVVDEQAVGPEAPPRRSRSTGCGSGLITGDLPQRGRRRSSTAPPPDKVEPSQFESCPTATARSSWSNEPTPEVSLLLNSEGRAPRQGLQGRQRLHPADGPPRRHDRRLPAVRPGDPARADPAHLRRRRQRRPLRAAAIRDEGRPARRHAPRAGRDAHAATGPGRRGRLPSPKRERSLGSFLFTQPEANSDRILQKVLLVWASRGTSVDPSQGSTLLPSPEPVDPPGNRPIGPGSPSRRRPPIKPGRSRPLNRVLDLVVWARRIPPRHGILEGASTMNGPSMSAGWGEGRPVESRRRWVSHGGHDRRGGAAPLAGRVESRTEEPRAVSSRLITLDGSRGEGGGQILRTALTLSLLTGRPFRIVKIRANRDKPGLRPQHLKAVEAAASLARGRGRRRLGRLARPDVPPRPRTSRATCTIDIGTAGSTALVLQTLHLPLALRAERPVRVTLIGGTFNDGRPVVPLPRDDLAGPPGPPRRPDRAGDALGRLLSPRWGPARRLDRAGDAPAPDPDRSRPLGPHPGRCRCRRTSGRRSPNGCATRPRPGSPSAGCRAEIELVDWSSLGQGAAISLSPTTARRDPRHVRRPRRARQARRGRRRRGGRRAARLRRRRRTGPSTPTRPTRSSSPWPSPRAGASTPSRPSPSTCGPTSRPSEPSSTARSRSRSPSGDGPGRVIIA